MSQEELRRLKAGQVVVNESRHKGFRTESRGFCFTADDPHEAIHYLSGNVDTEVCVTFEVPEGRFRKTRALYRDTTKDIPLELPSSVDDIDCIERTEYCTTRYSLKIVEILNVTTEFASIPGIKETQAMMKALGYRLNK